MKWGILMTHRPNPMYDSSLNSDSDWFGVMAGMKESSRLCRRGGGSNSLDPETPKDDPERRRVCNFNITLTTSKCFNIPNNHNETSVNQYLVKIQHELADLTVPVGNVNYEGIALGTCH